MRTTGGTKRRFVILLIVAFSLIAGNAMAESIKGRFGITGQVGFMVPSDSDSFTGSTSQKFNVNSNFAGGGGLIYGITDNLAVEAHVIYTPQLDFEQAGVKAMQLATTNASLGVQLRSNIAEEGLAAYLGGGVDVLFSDVQVGPISMDVDTVVGGHVSAGGDYFITKNVALNLDLRGVFFPNANIKAGPIVVGQYDPISFVALFGVRFFIN